MVGPVYLCTTGSKYTSGATQQHVPQLSLMRFTSSLLLARPLLPGAVMSAGFVNRPLSYHSILSQASKCLIMN